MDQPRLSFDTNRPPSIAPDFDELHLQDGETFKHPVTECLKRVQCGTNDPWELYLGHRGLKSFTMELKSDSLRPVFMSVGVNHTESWTDTESMHWDENLPLKLLIVAAEGDRTKANRPREDTSFMQTLFSRWTFHQQR